MASETITLVTDDLMGGPAFETITFGLDEATYQIDVNEENSRRLRSMLTEFIEGARQIDKKDASQPVRHSLSAQIGHEMATAVLPTAPARKRGRPKGSVTAAKAAVAETVAESSEAPARKRGRPKGSTNARKEALAVETPAMGDGPDPAAVREWAEKNNVPISKRGRIKSEVFEQYAAAHA